MALIYIINMAFIFISLYLLVFVFIEIHPWVGVLAVFLAACALHFALLYARKIK